jgi:hypothetical protein
MAKDFLGNEIKVGDEVVFVQKNYRNLLNGKIIKITDKMCVIGHDRTNVGGTETRQFHDQVVKVNIDKAYEDKGFLGPGYIYCDEEGM